MVEFAIAGPILVIAVIGAIEVGSILLTGALMEGAVRDAARYGVTGQDGLNRSTRIEQIIAERTIGLVDIQVAQVTTMIYGSFQVIGLAEPYTDDNPANGEYDPGEFFQDVNGNTNWDSDQGTPGAGNPGEIVLYTVVYDLSLLTASFLAHLIGHDGKVTMQAHVAVQNEPFDDNAV